MESMQNFTPWAETLRFAVELAATLAFALSGLLAAARKRLDAVGVFTVTFLAAFGGGTLRDLLLDRHGHEFLRHPRIPTRHTHGTGCTLASAVATGLAQGMPLTLAVRRARRYVQEAIRSAPGFGAGHGPLNHGHTAGLSDGL